ncbi:N-acetylgalactosamine kinase [Paragonimus westermani]|uniref:N-acetylgalactosamine kinase n=1 Tax=Paragonimus westermani TaxID=34504 RepID=A0A5J4NR41_9TREM|nr:N-acetylgalactosamine kinase [Paragonimus westermani]
MLWAVAVRQTELAVLIEFTKPLVTVHPVPLPSDVVFVIAHSGVHARKAATSMYNERVSECRIATRLLIKQSPDPELNASTRPLCLADAQQAWKLARPGLMLASEQTGESIVERCLKVGVDTRDQLLRDGRMTINELDRCLAPTTKNMTEFKLRARAEHVYAEAERTRAFYDLCQQFAAGDTSLLADLPQKLGELMNQSQESCAKLYECSCPALDELVNVCKSAGAIGSRLTGAGWGGCTVSLVPVADLTRFMHQIRRDYYEKRGLSQHEADQLVFVSKPAHPAYVMLVY